MRSVAPQTSFATRLARFLRLSGHLLAGLATLVLLFPRWPHERRHATMQRWAAGVLQSVCVSVECRGVLQEAQSGRLVVLNHVSWLDILLVLAVHPSTFIAKAEISRWPVVGSLVTRAGTLYIDRGSRRALRDVNELLSRVLETGRSIACFPEGSTSQGAGVERFHAGLFQPAIDAQVPVQPIALRYHTADGERADACAYVGDVSFLRSVWRVLSTPRLHAQLHFLEPLDARGANRRWLAERAREAIDAALNGAPRAQPLERRHGT